jgi:hypothetical protein
MVSPRRGRGFESAAVVGQLAWACLAIARGLAEGGNIDGIRQRAPGGVLGLLAGNLLLGALVGVLLLPLALAASSRLRRQRAVPPPASPAPPA